MAAKINGYTLRERERCQASPPAGADMHRQRWTEWQVVHGRKIVSRHDLRDQALRWIARNPLQEKTT